MIFQKFRKHFGSFPVDRGTAESKSTVYYREKYMNIIENGNTGYLNFEISILNKYKSKCYTTFAVHRKSD